MIIYICGGIIFIVSPLFIYFRILFEGTLPPTVHMNLSLGLCVVEVR